MKHIIKFQLEKATKNTYRYSEVAASPEATVVGALYIQKSKVGPHAPDSITVTIEEGQS